MTDSSPPQRRVVAHPQTLATLTGSPLSGPARSGNIVEQRRGPAGNRLREVDEQTALGVVLVRSLVRAQLKLALELVAALACVLGGLPLLFAVVPTGMHLRLLGLDVPWLVLGVLVYPMFVFGGWAYVRLAERNERDFLDIVHETERASPPDVHQ